MRYFCRVEYDGAQFSGWQVQPDRVTVQSILEEKMAIIAQHPISTICGGRTDSGVHGKGQSVHFDLDKEISPYRFVKGVNSLLPFSVAIYDMVEVPHDFHARFSATHREYTYTMVTRKSPLMENSASLITYQIDWKRVQEECKALIGEHVFTSFCASGYYSDNHKCTIELAEISFPSENIVQFRIKANRFVYKMVRTIVGTLIDIGRGKITKSMKEIIDAEDRLYAGVTAPSKGLTFDWVHYDDIP